MRPEDYTPDLRRIIGGRYAFLVETLESERMKTLSVWSLFDDGDMDVRPGSDEVRGRTPREQMIHQFVSEDGWFRKMLGIDVGAGGAPRDEPRLDLIERYAREAADRYRAIAPKPDDWWEGPTRFFEVERSRAWVVVRRIAHTAHHRGQLTAMLRAWGRELHSPFGPTADTGGLPVNSAPTIYPYPSIDDLIDGERAGGRKSPLPGPGSHPSTEMFLPVPGR